MCVCVCVWFLNQCFVNDSLLQQTEYLNLDVPSLQNIILLMDTLF